MEGNAGKDQTMSVIRGSILELMDDLCMMEEDPKKKERLLKAKGEILAFHSTSTPQPPIRTQNAQNLVDGTFPYDIQTFTKTHTPDVPRDISLSPVGAVGESYPRVDRYPSPPFPSQVSVDQNPMPTNMNINEMPTSHKALFKAKDIDQLKLTEMHEVGGKGVRKFFFKQIRLLGGNEEDKIQLALSRMDTNLRPFIDGKLNSMPSRTVNCLEDLLNREFKGPSNLADAVRNLHSVHYSMSEDPRKFANIFKTRFEMVYSAFPEETRPKRETVLKQILMQDLPLQIKNRLSCFMTEGYSEDLFISELERERLNRDFQVATVQERPTYSQPARSPPVSDTRNRLGPYPCRYCQDGNRHTPRNCPLNPPPGGCYDCLSSTHRRGDRGCPGRTNREVQRNDPQRPQ